MNCKIRIVNFANQCDDQSVYFIHRIYNGRKKIKISTLLFYELKGKKSLLLICLNSMMLKSIWLIMLNLIADIWINWFWVWIELNKQNSLSLVEWKLQIKYLKWIVVLQILRHMRCNGDFLCLNVYRIIVFCKLFYALTNYKFHTFILINEIFLFFFIHKCLILFLH